MATEQLWNGFDGKKLLAERAVCDEVGQNIVDTYATKSGVPSVYNAKLKLQLGSGQATDTGFTANASADATLTVPEMTGATASTAGASGLVPAPAVADKDKFLKGDGTWTTPPEVTPTPRQIGALAANDTYVNGGTVYSLVISAPQKPASIFTYTDEGNRRLTYWGVPYNGTTTGQVLTYNSGSGPYWAMPENPLPTPTHDNELFVGMSDGSSSWKQLSTVGGNSTQLLDENDDPILDETGAPIYDDDPILWKTLDNRGFYAERALADSDGQEIKSTYSTVAYTDSAISSLAQQVEAGYQRKLLYGSDYSHQQEYILIDGNWVPTDVDVVPNNAVTYIPRTIFRNGDVIRVMCKVNRSAQESPNFAIELEPFALSASDTATIEVYIQPNGPKSAYLARHSMACSTTVAPDKYYQITCVGKCWTIVEFGTDNA